MNSACGFHYADGKKLTSLSQSLSLLGAEFLSVAGCISSVQFRCSVMSDSAAASTAAHQASLSITNSRRLLKLISIELVMTYNHLILCRPLLFLPSIFPSIRVFSNASTLHMRWPKYWSFRFSIIPSKEIPGLISFT